MRSLDTVARGDTIIFKETNMIRSDTYSSKQIESEVLVLKALNHPARIAILRILQDGEHCVCHMEAYLGYRQAYISQQLSVLRDSGLIDDRRDGWNVFYRVTDLRIFEILDLVQQISGGKKDVFESRQVDCACPHCTSKTQTVRQIGSSGIYAR